MKGIIVFFLFALPFFSQSQEPGLKKEYSPLVALSLMGGIHSGQYTDGPAPVYGIEFSLECPLVQTRKSHIRQQFSLIRQEGRKSKSLTVGINPQYKIIARPSFELGAGPYAGLVFSNKSESSKAIFCYGPGGSVIWHCKILFVGLESRYTVTKKVALTGINDKPGSVANGNLNNWGIFLKLGYKFYK